MIYKDLLKDPRWKKKRLSILKRDNHTCLECSGKNKELHVHHIYYEVNRLPWEYPDSALVTLCKDCHTAYHSDEKQIIVAIINNFKKSGFRLSEFFDISMSFAGLSDNDSRLIYVLRHILNNDKARAKAIAEFEALTDEQKYYYYLVKRIS